MSMLPQPVRVVLPVRLRRTIDQALHHLRRRFPLVGGPLALAAGTVRLVTSEASVLRATGWLASLRLGRPVDADGNEAPWFNFQMAELLAERLPANARVFEFGSGSSTRWLARRARVVVSVETDEVWFRSVSGSVPDNVSVALVDAREPTTYAHQPHVHGGEFDLVLIDGVAREECLRVVASSLSTRGVIVLDDSERSGYGPSVESLCAEGFRELRFRGLKPLAVRNSISCSVLYRDGNCLGL